MKKFMCKSILILLVLALTYIPAHATNWVRIGDGHYVDADSIAPTDRHGAFTLKTKYIASGEPLEIMHGKEIWTIRTNSYVDCVSNYAKTISYAAYDKRERVVSSSRHVGKQWYEINRPGTRAYESYEFVCTDNYINAWHDYDSLWKY